MGFGVRFRDQVGAEFGAPAGGWRAVCRGPVAGGSQEGGRAVAGLAAGAQGLVSPPARGSPPTGLRKRAGLPRDLPSLPPLPALQAHPARQCERPSPPFLSRSPPLSPLGPILLLFSRHYRGHRLRSSTRGPAPGDRPCPAHHRIWQERLAHGSCSRKPRVGKGWSCHPPGERPRGLRTHLPPHWRLSGKAHADRLPA